MNKVMVLWNTMLDTDYVCVLRFIALLCLENYDCLEINKDKV